MKKFQILVKRFVDVSKTDFQEKKVSSDTSLRKSPSLLLLLGFLAIFITGTILLVAYSAPTVYITQPLPLDKVAGQYTVRAIAEDDVGLAGGQFFIDGTPISMHLENVMPIYDSDKTENQIDIPTLMTSNFEKGASIIGYQYNYYAYWYSYRWPDGPHKVSVIVKDVENLPGEDYLYAFASNNLHNDPIIALVTKKSNPFRIIVTGSNFQPGALVFIGDNITSAQYKSSNKLIVKGGNTLKALLPKGIPVSIVVSNPDGGASSKFNYVRP